jgi:hypothetical protein
MGCVTGATGETAQIWLDPTGGRHTTIAPGAVPLLMRDMSSIAALDRSDPLA